LETKRSSGTFVSESYVDYLSQRLNWDLVFTKQELRHIIEIRCALEEQAAGLAAERATDQQIANLVDLVDAINVPGIKPELAVEKDIAFHIAVAEASNNPLLHNLILNLRQVLHGYIKAGYLRRGYGSQVDAEEMANLHRPIVEAIQTANAADAQKAMHQHFQNTSGWQLAQAEQDQNI
ncbi:MAG: FCD domain-containing protein, partial [Chloroflexota bacterium]